MFRIVHVKQNGADALGRYIDTLSDLGAAYRRHARIGWINCLWWRHDQPGRRRFELLGLLCKREGKPRGGGLNTDRFRFNGARRAFQTADMPTEAKKH